MPSKAETVDAYLAELTDEDRAVVTAVRDVVVEHLPAGYDEQMNWGMICYEVPLETYPETYNGQPLQYAALTRQKRHFALYLSAVYQNPERAQWLQEQYDEAGLKLDMGKSCLRFKRLDQLPLSVIGELIGAVPPAAFIEEYEAARAGAGKSRT